MGSWRRALTVGSVLGALLLALSGGAGGASTTGHGVPPGTVLVTDLNGGRLVLIDPLSRAVSAVSGPSLRGPLGVAVTPDGRTALVTNSLGASVTPVDLTTVPPTLGVPVKVGRAPAAVAISSSGERAYVTDFNDNEVTPLALSGGRVRALAPIRVGAGPWSVAVSPDGSAVVVSDTESQSVSVINTASGSVTTVSVGARPEAVVVAPSGSVAYVAAGQGITPVVLGGHPHALSSIPVAGGPLGLAITPDGRRAYSANGDRTVTPIDLTVTPPRAESSVTVGSLTQPDGVAISPDGRRAYAANATDTVAPIDLTTHPVTPLAPISVGSATFGIAIVPDQAPVAHLIVHPARAGHPSVLDASRSTSSDGGILSYSWDFGDGHRATTRSAVVHHVYATAGNYRASVTVTSRYGTSTATTFTGQTASNHGGLSARAQRSFAVVSALTTVPSSGPPGIAVHLRDDSLSATCSNLFVYFDNRLIDQVPSQGRSLDIPSLVVPGDASLGGHELSIRCSTTGAALTTASFQVVATLNHLAEFSVAMPSARELSHHLAGATGISLLLLLVSRLISAGFPSQWLDATYEANRHRWLSRWRTRLPWLFVDHSRERSTARRAVGGAARFVLFAVFAGFINSVLDPSFGWNRTTLWLFLGQCLGIGTLLLSAQLPALIGGLRQHRTVHLQVLLGGLVIAILCVGASRALGLSPGYCYGLIVTFVVAPKVSMREWGKLQGYASITVIVLALAAFALRGPVFRAAAAAHPSPWLLVLTPALDILFVGGFTSVAFGMFPLPFLPGRHMAQWSRPAWIAISFVALVGFVAVLLSRGSGSPSELAHVALVPLIAAFSFFGLASLALMLYFHRHPLEEPEVEEPTGATEGS